MTVCIQVLADKMGLPIFTEVFHSFSTSQMLAVDLQRPDPLLSVSNFLCSMLECFASTFTVLYRGQEGSFEEVFMSA